MKGRYVDLVAACPRCCKEVSLDRLVPWEGSDRRLCCIPCAAELTPDRKPCRRCKRSLPVWAFGVRDGAPVGARGAAWRRSKCRPCIAEEQRERHERKRRRAAPIEQRAGLKGRRWTDEW